MRWSTVETLRLSRRYLDLIGGQPMSLIEKQAFIAETVDAYEKHVNRGFISYRKSVTEAGQFAALEWSGHGALLQDLLGREYIDCLGGFGIFSAGINHPLVVKAVQDQMGRMALNSQELLEPWRAALARLLAATTPGELGCCFFINNGTDAVEGAIKLARLYTKRNTFLSTLGGFHGKSLGSLSLMGKASFREPFLNGLQDVRYAPFGDAGALEAEFAKAQAVGTPIGGGRGNFGESTTGMSSRTSCVWASPSAAASCRSPHSFRPRPSGRCSFRTRCCIRRRSVVTRSPARRELQRSR